MIKHMSFPSIGQFRDTVKQIRSSAKYFEVEVPVVSFTGTVKLHGTNFGICRPVNGDVDSIYFQSRERIITPVNDNAGSAMWGYANRVGLNGIFDAIKSAGEYDDDQVIQLFGEWAGGNVQKGVGISNVEKSFFVFAIRVSVDSASTKWFTETQIQHFITSAKDVVPNLYSIYEFPHWTVDIDFNAPENIQNKLVELTLEVEKDCPVARQLVPEFDGTMIGEGIVWRPTSGQILPFDVSSVIFKVKGEKHSVSKVNKLATVDVEKVASITEFVEKTVTQNRLHQGIDKMLEMGLEIEPKNTGAYIKWVTGDIFKEEMDTLVESGLTTKDVTHRIANDARKFFLAQM